jgi:hypothetical protein
VHLHDCHTFITFYNKNMANRQIGWSNEANLLWEVSNLITRLTQVTAANSGGGGGVTSFNTRVGNVSLLSSDVTTALGYTPVTSARTLTINGVAFDLSANRSWTIASGGGSSIAYYLNGSVNQGTIGGSVYYEMNKTPIIGAGTDFSIAGNGLISQFITDVADPNRLQIPAGNWTFEMYMSASSPGGTPRFYLELLKYDGTTFTSIASSSATPEGITNGTTIDLYVTALAVPFTTLLATDRLALRVYIVNSAGGRTITMHTENSHLCEIITNFPGGVSTLNGLTANTQYFATGTSGTDFAISSLTDTHTFNLPTASATNRGALSSADWTTFNNKQAALTLTTTGTSGASTLVGATLNIPDLSTVTTNRQTASYTLVLTDRGKLVEMNVATANNLTVPLDSSVALPIGTEIEIAQYGAGQTTIVATGGVTIRSASGNLKIASQYVAISLIKIGTNEWYCFGNLSA